MKATNIVLQSSTTDVYSQCASSQIAKDFMGEVSINLVQRNELILLVSQGNGFSTAIASSRFPSTNNQLRTSLNPRSQATIKDGRVIVQQVQRRQGQSYSGTGYKSNATSSRGNNASVEIARSRVQWFKRFQAIIPNNAGFRLRILELVILILMISLKANSEVLMVNISNYGSDIILVVPYFETYLNDMENQSVHTMQDFEQLPVVDFTNNEIHSDSNIIPYSKYLQETQLKTIQDTNNWRQQGFNDLYYFGKRFTPQQELSAEQAFWLRISNPTIESSNIPPVKMEVPSELPKVSLVNASLKNLKFYLAQFDSVVKKRTTPDARTEDE
ncbi:hypothetical protein Tco_0558402 [Tanacetum coccineum]